MATYSNTAREVEMPNGDVVVIHNAPTGGENTTSNIKKFKYDDNGHVTESTAANATDLNLNSYSTPTTGSTAIGTSDAVQTAIGKLDHQSQIDQSNILLVEQMNGAKNLAEINDATFTRDMYIPCKLKANTDYRLMIQSFTSESLADTSQLLFYKGDTQVTDEQGGVYRSVPHGNNISKTVQIPAECDRLRIYSGSEGESSDNKSATFTHLMFIEESIYEAGLTQYMPFALPNTDLTVLEAEDRAALAEVVDSGNKNLLRIDLNPYEARGLTYTLSDGQITITGDNNGEGNSNCSIKSFLAGEYDKYIGCVLTGAASNNTVTSLVVQMGESPWMNIASLTKTDEAVILPAQIGNISLIGKKVTIYIMTKSGETGVNVTFKPMICSKEDWDVSHKFKPYSFDSINSKNYSAITTNGTFAQLIKNATKANGVTGVITYMASIYSDTSNEYLLLFGQYNDETFHNCVKLANNTIDLTAVNMGGTIACSGGTGTLYAKVKLLI